MPRLDPCDLLTPSSSPPQWLIRDFLYQSSLVVLAGDPGVGKSILSYTAAIAVSSGIPFLGLPVAQGRVLYLDEENSLPDAQEYFRWAWRGSDCPSPEVLSRNLRFEHFSVSSFNGPWYDFMAQAAREHRPSLIIIDTATPACRVVDENNNSEAAKVIQQLRRVQLAADNSTSLIVLKHARLSHDPIGNEYRTVRGAKSWIGAPDGVIFHVASAGRPRSDNLRPTRLEPYKTRAWGLRAPLVIDPQWVTHDPAFPATLGLKLSAAKTE